MSMLIQRLAVGLSSLLFLSSNPVSSEIISTEIQQPKLLSVGEDLTYVVRYSFIKLGEVRLQILDNKKIKGKSYFFTRAYIDSYPSIPFVNLHQIYESKLTDNYFSSFFRGTVKYDDYSSFTEYYFNYENSKLKVIKGKVNPREIWTDSITTAEKQYQDGLSIFYYARMNTGKKNSVDVPCFVNEKKVNTHLNFYTDITGISVPSIDYEVACTRLDGYTDFVSVFGLTGNFEGWFTNDEAAIPILAKMKVIIGNVTLELKEWKREGWVPPKYSGKKMK